MGGEEREERVVELRNMAGHKRGLTDWRGGRGRSELVSFKTWQVTNEDSPTGGEEEGGAGWWPQKGAVQKTRITSSRARTWRRKLAGFEKGEGKNEESVTRGEAKGEGGWWASK